MSDPDTEAISDPEATLGCQAALAARIRAAVQAAGPEASGVRRVSVPLGRHVEPLDWVQAQRVHESGYWSTRADDRAVATAGAADVLRSADLPVNYAGLETQLDKRLSDAPPDVRYYGGLRFDAPQPQAPDEADRSWEAFGTCRFVLPRFELVSTDGATGTTPSVGIRP